MARSAAPAVEKAYIHSEFDDIEDISKLVSSYWTILFNLIFFLKNAFGISVTNSRL
jgi:hypothetical protein